MDIAVWNAHIALNLLYHLMDVTVEYRDGAKALEEARVPCAVWVPQPHFS